VDAYSVKTFLDSPQVTEIVKDEWEMTGWQEKDGGIRIEARGGGKHHSDYSALALKMMYSGADEARDRWDH
jgi:hypothetical protein